MDQDSVFPNLVSSTPPPTHPSGGMPEKRCLGRSPPQPTRPPPTPTRPHWQQQYCSSTCAAPHVMYMDMFVFAQSWHEDFLAVPFDFCDPSQTVDTCTLLRSNDTAVAMLSHTAIISCNLKKRQRLRLHGSAGSHTSRMAYRRLTSRCSGDRYNSTARTTDFLSVDVVTQHDQHSSSRPRRPAAHLRWVPEGLG